MEYKLADSAQFLIIKNGVRKKVSAFIGFPVDIDHLMPIHRDDAAFLKEGMYGFSFVRANKESATIKILCKDEAPKEIAILFGQKQTLKIGNCSFDIELWAVRLDSTHPDSWYVSPL